MRISRPHGRRPQRICAASILPLLLVLGLTPGCEQTPVSGSVDTQALPAPPAGMASSFSMPVVPPAAARGIQDLLHRWTASWESMDGIAYGANYAEDADFVNPLGGILSGRAQIGATHVFLFGGPFKGSTKDYEIRRMVSLTGDLAIVDLNVTLTGYAFLPPGLVATDGVVRTRERLVVGRVGGEWLILAQQLTSIAP
jgi:uncharacterized protein (TIGR02246 family)